nr:hypothetical protein [Corynebacterium pollutisoli]
MSWAWSSGGSWGEVRVDLDGEAGRVEGGGELVEGGGEVVADKRDRAHRPHGGAHDVEGIGGGLPGPQHLGAGLRRIAVDHAGRVVQAQADGGEAVTQAVVQRGGDALALLGQGQLPGVAQARPQAGVGLLELVVGALPVADDARHRQSRRGQQGRGDRLREHLVERAAGGQVDPGGEGHDEAAVDPPHGRPEPQQQHDERHPLHADAHRRVRHEEEGEGHDGEQQGRPRPRIGAPRRPGHDEKKGRDRPGEHLGRRAVLREDGAEEEKQRDAEEEGEKPSIHAPHASARHP